MKMMRMSQKNYTKEVRNTKRKIRTSISKKMTQIPLSMVLVKVKKVLVRIQTVTVQLTILRMLSILLLLKAQKTMRLMTPTKRNLKKILKKNPKKKAKQQMQVRNQTIQTQTMTKIVIPAMLLKMRPMMIQLPQIPTHLIQIVIMMIVQM